MAAWCWRSDAARPFCLLQIKTPFPAGKGVCFCCYAFATCALALPGSVNSFRFRHRAKRPAGSSPLKTGKPSPGPLGRRSQFTASYKRPARNMPPFLALVHEARLKARCRKKPPPLKGTIFAHSFFRFPQRVPAESAPTLHQNSPFPGCCAVLARRFWGKGIQKNPAILKNCRAFCAYQTQKRQPKPIVSRGNAPNTQVIFFQKSCRPSPGQKGGRTPPPVIHFW